MQIKNLVVKYFYQASQSQGTEMHNTPVSLNALFKGISSTVSDTNLVNTQILFHCHRNSDKSTPKTPSQP